MKTVLIIEDEPNLREALVVLLSLADYEVIQAENGLVGIQLAQKHKIDLILCDLKMPQMDGYQVLQHIRKESELANVPFFIMSANPALRTNWDVDGITPDGILPKPFVLENFEKLLESLQQND